MHSHIASAQVVTALAHVALRGRANPTVCKVAGVVQRLFGGVATPLFETVQKALVDGT